MLHLIKTEDGSHTLRDDELNETYHSIHGAIQESNHIYIKNGLHYYFEKVRPESIRILEVGFGTGLNALLACLDNKTNGLTILYDAVEAFPLSRELTDQLNFPDCLGIPEAQAILKRIHKAAWGEITSINQRFILQKINKTIQSLVLEEECYDIVYFDAFAPSKQPEIWNFKILSPVIRAIKSEGILVTYCARGQFKRDLKTLDMEVKSPSGPPGKLEMVRATRHIF